MRTTKELLILLRDELKSETLLWQESGSLCNLAEKLRLNYKVSRDEYYLIKQHLHDFSPNSKNLQVLWFKLYSMKPRLKWLNEQINKL